MPDEFGRHLVWAWNRVRDGHLFFPPYRRELATRLNTDLPDARSLHEEAVDLLRAGDGYRAAYAATFRHGGTKVREAISGLQVPTAIVAHEDDPLPVVKRAYPATCQEPPPQNRAERGHYKKEDPARGP